MEFETSIKVTYKVNLNDEDLKRANLDPEQHEDIIDGLQTFCWSEMEGGTFSGYLWSTTIAEHIGYELVRESGWPLEVCIAWHGTREEDNL